MGILNSGATFQRNMEKVLAGLNWVNCLVYVDDVIIFSDTFDKHLQDIEVVLGQIQKA